MLKRLRLWAILFSRLPALILAQASKKDRLTLDFYLEFARTTTTSGQDR